MGTITSACHTNNGNAGCNHGVVGPSGRLYIAFMDNNQKPGFAYTDDRINWTEVVLTGMIEVVNRVALCVDSDEKVTLVYSRTDNHVDYNTWTEAGGWLGGGVVIGSNGSFPDVAVGPNKVPQFIYNIVGSSSRIWHYDPVNGATQITGNVRSLYGWITIDQNNTAHILYPSGTDLQAERNRTINYKQLPFGGSPTAQETLATGATDDGYMGGDIIIDSNGTIWAVYQKYDGSNKNIFLKYRIAFDDWAVPEEVTDCGGNFQDLPSIGVDRENTLHIYWRSLGYGSFPLKKQIAYRKRLSDGTWVPALGVDDTWTAITDEDKDHIHPHAIHNIERPPRKGMGMAYVNVDDTDLIWYETADLEWPFTDDSNFIIDRPFIRDDTEYILDREFINEEN